MASLISHAVAALGIGTIFARPQIPKRVWVIGAVCSILPDIDVIGFRFGIRYGDFWGHRGFTHSLLFASILATLALVVGFPHALSGLKPHLAVAIFLCCGGEPRIFARHDEWRPWRGVLLAFR